ncbi:hypothetical protein EQJ94_27545, partial [Escherichia coli]|nr:hypothetical protein [Escherichia coli]
LSGLPETPCPGRGEPEQSGDKQQNAPHHKRSEPAGETVTVWRSKSIVILNWCSRVIFCRTYGH